MAENIAAWYPEKSRPPVKIDKANMPIPAPGELVIKTEAVGINPADAKIQKFAFIPFTYPLILGNHVSGVVHAVGEGVERFQIGDRVASATPFYVKNDSRYGGFQRYTLTGQKTTFKIGDFPFSEAVPFATTGAAASALFLHLKIARPTGNIITPRNEKVLIWGGSSTVGGYAVQFAALAGYEVISTCSKHNIPYVTSLGAKKVYDRADEEILTKLLAEGPFSHIFDASGEATEIIGQLFPPSGGFYITSLPASPSAKLPAKVTAQFVQFLDDYYKPENAEFVKWFYWDFLEKLVLEKKLIPTPQEVRGGLSALQGALDDHIAHKVSGKKLIILPQQD